MTDAVSIYLPGGVQIPLPPSAQAVAAALQKNGRLTMDELAKKTGLQKRTLRYGMSRLRGFGLIVERMDLRDMRRVLYEMKPGVV